ncbi:hypothetical protein ACERII_24630 [Evansella sp. AB-rgal1]|uniref:hypothetical protein n=1 Tax=Evansella sp. AB-rgal1 TaxID=3242696 RepID=UPI00359EBB7A
MSKKMEKKLYSLPKVKLDQGKKQRMLNKIINEGNETSAEKRWKSTKGFLLSVGGTSVTALLAFIIFILPILENNRTPAFLMEEDVRNMEELGKFDWTIMLPTYAPFDIHEVEYSEFIGGEIRLEDGEVVHVNANDLEHILGYIDYFSHDESERLFQVYLGNPYKLQYEEIDRYDEIIQFGDRLEGKYYETTGESSSTQFFSWEEEGLLREFKVTAKENESLPIEEIIKIAESFMIFQEGVTYNIERNPHTTFEELLLERLKDRDVDGISVSRYEDNRMKDNVIVEDDETISNILADLSSVKLEEVPFGEIAEGERGDHTHTLRIMANGSMVIAIEIFEKGYWDTTVSGSLSHLVLNEVQYLDTIENGDLHWQSRND